MRNNPNIKTLKILTLLLTVFVFQISHTQTRIKSKSKLSDRLEQLSFKDLNNKPIKLINLIGQPIFINFWASWCAPCKSEMTSISQISKVFKDKFIFIIASNEELPIISQYKLQSNIDLNFVHMDQSYIDAFIIKLPTTIIIDQNCNIIMEEEGYRNWTDPVYINKLKAILK